METTGSVKCSCCHCDGHLEFDRGYAGECITCPHCGKQTVLYVPGKTLPPPAAPPTVAQPLSLARSFARPDFTEPPAPPLARPLTPIRPRTPSKSWALAPQLARASWVSFLCALACSGFFGTASEQMRPALRTFILVLLSVGLVFGVIALAGLRKYAIRGILIPALIGILLNGSLLGGLHRARRIGMQRRQQAEVSAKSALTISDAVRQLNDQGLITNILPTGDARFDPTVRIWVEVINTTATLASSMDSEVKALGERDIFSALGSRASIKSEIDKRLAAEQMIEKSHQECRAAVDSGRQRLRALKLPKDLERMALTPLDSGGKFCSNIETTWSLRLRMKQAETALLQFLYSEFGRYRVSNRQVLFTSGAKLQEFNRLTDNFNNLVTEAKELESQHEAQRQAVRNQVQQGAP